MNERYLWDKTGETDPEIKELEQLLGTFRYRPRTIEIPRAVPLHRRFFLPLTIAASIAILMVGFAVWFTVNRTNSIDSRESARANPSPDTKPNAKLADVNKPAAVVDRSEKSSDRSVIPNPNVAGINVRHRRPVRPQTLLTPAERLEAQNAKEQLIVALRLASNKLNLAHKRAQGIQTSSPTRYQHKTG